MLVRTVALSTTWKTRLAGFVILFAAFAAVQSATEMIPFIGPAERWGSLCVLGCVAGLGVALMDRWLLRGPHRFESLSTLGRRLADQADVQGVTATGLDSAMEISRADVGVIFTTGPDDTLIAGAFKGFPSRSDEVVDLDAGTFAGRAAASGVPEVFRPSLEPHLPVGYLPLATYSTVVAIPLKVEEGLQGLILLGFTRERNILPTDLETLKLVGAQVAIALHYRRLLDRLALEARTDPLTGVGSRRMFDEHYPREVARAIRTRRPLSLAVLDLDGFKRVNDVYGHPTGDRVLKEVAAILSTCRTGDLVARYGGDEFVVLMPDTSVESARGLMTRMEGRLDALNERGVFPFPIAFSVGVAEMKEPGADLLASADAAMYRNKQAHKLVDDAYGSRRALASWRAIN